MLHLIIPFQSNLVAIRCPPRIKSRRCVLLYRVGFGRHLHHKSLDRIPLSGRMVPGARALLQELIPGGVDSDGRIRRVEYGVVAPRDVGQLSRYDVHLSVSCRDQSPTDERIRGEESGDIRPR
jgi:hypothetical protein